VEFRILGPLEVAVDGSTVTLGSGKQRALLGVLLLHVNKVVSTERLVDELWGARPPPTSGKLVQVYVSQLRRTLDAAGAKDVLRTRPPGYVAELEPEQLDAMRFERLLDRARTEADAGSAEEAVASYDEALGLWRGAVLADVVLESEAGGEAGLLEELRLAALTEQTDCALALGRHAELIGRLESLTLEHPLHERLWAQLMLALYRSGRQSEALGAYHQARRTLVEQVGLDPSPELHRLEKAILAHDPSLELSPQPRPEVVTQATAPAAAETPRLARYRIPVAVGAAALMLAAAGTVLVVARGGHEAAPLAVVSSDSVVIVEPAGNVLADEIELHTRPTALAYGDGSLWVGAGDDGTLLQIDPRTHDVRTIGLGAPPIQIALADGFVWVLTSEHTLFQLRSGRGSLVRRVALPETVRVGRYSGQSFRRFHPGCGALAAGAGAAWVGCWLPVAVRVDERTGTAAQLAVACAGGIAFDGRAVWCAGATVSPDRAAHPQGELSRVDPGTRKITQTIAPPGVGPDTNVDGVATGADAIWVINATNQALWKIDPALGRATAVVSLHHAPAYVAVGDDTVWTANRDGTLSRVDARSARLLRTIPLGAYPRTAYPTQIAAGGDRIWVGMH
jgi:DNA-binding SARP family transcriptional activator/outer membrane protein assembly factor BamB